MKQMPSAGTGLLLFAQTIGDIFSLEMRVCARVYAYDGHINRPAGHAQHSGKNSEICLITSFNKTAFYERAESRELTLNF